MLLLGLTSLGSLPNASFLTEQLVRSNLGNVSAFHEDAGHLGHTGIICDDELTPNLGTPTDPGYEDGHGAYFCDFLMKTVIPYVEKNYNVYTDRDHTAICGSSSGGIESFYIAMEHPEKFGTVGALSPAFSLFDNETWNKYLTKKDFSKGYPRVYIYCGEGNDLESALLPGAKDMPENLSKINYPAENIYYYTAKKALHNELYWRVIFPDFLKYLYN